ncbi:MAG: alkaline phosphatase PhoX [Pseudonocardiaceae bacterium]
MSRAQPRWPVVVGAAAVVSILTATTATAATATGPNTVTPPYVLPFAPGVTITSLLTVDDAGKASNGYEMVGIPDGLGARRTGDTVTVLMNHELNAAQGIVRRHGQQGAFVSELTLNRHTNEVVTGRDLINPGVQYWNYLTGSYAATPNGAGTQSDGDVFPAYDPRFGRFCSGRLTEPGQLFNVLTLTGYQGQLYFANEEVGDEGRNFAVTTDGQATELPRLGLFSWENTLPAPNRSNTTLVMGNEDTAAGQLWAYVGTKQRSGSPVDKAGLTNGRNFVADLVDEAVSTDAGFRTTFGKGVPARFDLSEVDWDQSGKDQNTDALAQGLTLNRIEDGAFDPRRPNDFYFVTTAGGNGPGGGLWRLRWDTIENPAAGGTLTLLLDGSEGLVSPDNIDVDSKGNVVVQEDPGNNPHVARIMAYRISDGALGTLARFNPALFTSGTPGFITQDEESSGIIDAARVYRHPSLSGLPFFVVQELEASGIFDLLDIAKASGTFLFDAQVHAPTVNNVAEYVERGQLMRMHVDDWRAIYGS